MGSSEKQDQLPEEVTEDEVQELVGQLPGIQSCRLVCNDWGAIEEFHVLAGDERHPKQIVRDIESALAAKWGLQVDHKRVSVASLTSGSGRSGEQSTGSGTAWIELVSIRSTSHPGQQYLEVEVTVRTASGDATGRADGGIARAKHGRLSAEAATRALNEILPPGHYIQMEDIRSVDMAAGPVVCVQHSLLRQRIASLLIVGAAPVQGDDWSRAAVQATVAAVNYHIEHFSAANSAKRE